MRSQREYVRAILIGAVAAVLLAASAAAYAGWFLPERQLTTSSASPEWPAISGTKVVYSDYRNGNSDIYLYDLATSSERRLTTNAAEQSAARISGTKVVYSDSRNGNSDIYLYDLSTDAERRLTTSAAAQSDAAISGNRVVYMDNRNGNLDTYLYNLTTNSERRLTTNTADQKHLAISGNRVVYEDRRNGNWDIYLYDLETNSESRLTTNAADQSDPAISGTNVAYHDNRNGNWDIYLYDLSTNTETRLTTSAAKQMDIGVSGSNVAYGDDRNGTEDIYLYNLSTDTEHALATGPGYQTSPAISDTRIVYDDSTKGICLIELALPKLSAATPPVVPFGAEATVTGTLNSATDAAIAGRPVSLLALAPSAGGTWTSVSTTLTQTNGAYTLSSSSLAEARSLKVGFAGDADYYPAASAKMTVKPRVALTAPSAPASVSHRATFTSAGYLQPRHAARTSPVRLQCYHRERLANGTQRYVLRKTVSATAADHSTYTKYKASVSLLYVGSWRIRAYHPADALNAATYSGWSYVTAK